MTAVVFDFDGVLVDTEPLHLRAFQEAFAVRGWVLGADAYVDRYLGYDDRDLLRTYALDHGLTLDDAAFEEILAIKGAMFERALSPDGVLYPGAAACVRRLAARFPLGIASGSLHREIDGILARAGLRDPFRVIVGTDDVARSKPAPDSYTRAAELLRADPRRSVAIEDSPWGLAAAAAAGFRTIAVTTTSARDTLRAADRIVDSLDELTLDLVAELAGPATP